MKKSQRRIPSAGADAASQPPQQPLPVLKPATQVDFYARLQAVKSRYLHGALKETIEDARFDLCALDGELASFADAASLKRLASFHLRGETFFPVPYLLKRNAYLLGYYRLLYGFSCKAFYGQGPFKRFQRMEDGGLVDLRTEPSLPALCRSLCATGGMLLEAIKGVSLGTVFELQLLTLGPQFKGGGNVKVGQSAIDTFFMLLKSLLSPYNPKVKGRRLHS
jgi:XcyI-like restriction endonuclease